MILSLIKALLLLAPISLTLQQSFTPGVLCSSIPFRFSYCLRHGSKEKDYSEFTYSPDSSPSPWKFRSNCTTASNNTEPFCIFSSQSFAGGRGFSILTKPNRAEKLQKLPAFTDPDAISFSVNDQPPSFEEREISGKGRGLVANKTLHRGDLIFTYTPIMILDSEASKDLGEKQSLGLEHAAVTTLPQKTQEIFWDLYGQPNMDPVRDRIDSNAFELELDGIMYYMVYPETAHLNHDCRPNLVYFFDQKTLTQQVHAITEISPGTELTIAYINPHMVRRQRLRALSTSWGFTCSCSLCALHPELAHASDERLVQISALRKRLEDWETASPQIAQTLISLYEQERLYARSGIAYWYAALTSCAEGLRWDTIRYAQLGVEFGLLDGDFRGEKVQVLKKLAVRPEDHSCWLKRYK